MALYKWFVAAGLRARISVKNTAGGEEIILFCRFPRPVRCKPSNQPITLYSSTCATMKSQQACYSLDRRPNIAGLKYAADTSTLHCTAFNPSPISFSYSATAGKKNS
jgi:hypothetical protein